MPLFVGQIVTVPLFPHQCIPYSSTEKKTENFYFCNIFFFQWGAIASSRKPDLQRCVLKHS